MKQLKDLKDELLANKVSNFYIFYGQDFGLRRHYIQRIAKSYDSIKVISSALEIADTNSAGSGLFKTSTIFVVYNDIEFAKSRLEVLQTFLKRLKDDCVILVYEDEQPNTNLFKEFSDYITYFPTVNDNIALEFVDSEVKLCLASKEELITNCKNDYSKICLEADKIRNYAESKGLHHQAAYDDLKAKGQLLYEYPEFDIDGLLDDILLGNFNNLAYWCDLINKKYYEQFWIMLMFIFNNYLIGYCIAKYGSYRGSSLAYDLGLPWGRIKQVKNYIIPYKPDQLLESAFEVAKLDLEVKSGRITLDKLFDHFICTIL